MGNKASSIPVCCTVVCDDSNSQQKVKKEVKVQLDLTFLRTYERYRERDGSFDVQRILDNTKPIRSGVRLIRDLADFRKTNCVLRKEKSDESLNEPDYRGPDSEEDERHVQLDLILFIFYVQM